MIFALRQVFIYLQHSIKSFRLHGIHSPFVFNLYHQVIHHTGEYYAFFNIEKLRKTLITQPDIIQVTDFGAGSRTNNQSIKTIRHIAKHAAAPPWLAQFFFRLVNFQKPQTVVEIGTSLGLTTAYLASANKKAKVYTLEGCRATAEQAQQNFKNLNLTNIQLIPGNFDETLPALLTQLPSLDFVLFDGNHRLEPTLCYFNWCLSSTNESSVFLFDDIYWSEEMQQAWQQICAHPAVTISIDLFYLGIVFFRKNQPKQHFNIKF